MNSKNIETNQTQLQKQLKIKEPEHFTLTPALPFNPVSTSTLLACTPGLGPVIKL